MSQEFAIDAPFVPTYANALAGSIIQVVHYQTGALISTDVTIPWDDTVPQQSEGAEVMTLTITPKSATNNLLIFVTAICSGLQTTFTIAVPLFQDSTANAIACGEHAVDGDGNNNCPKPVTYSHYMTAGTTSATTFKVRIGSRALSSVNTATLNGRVAYGRDYGGCLASSITIMEVKV